MLLGIPLLGWLYVTTGRAQVQRAMADARAGGTPLTFEEIEAARKVWPDDENGARIILELADRLDHLRVLDGEVVLDENGEGWVELPEWFQPVGEEFVISVSSPGGFVPVRVAEREGRHRFRIVDGRPGLPVAWFAETGMDALPIVGQADAPPLGQRWSDETDRLVASLLRCVSAELAAIDQLADFEGGRLPFEISGDPLDTLFPERLYMRTSFNVKMLQVVRRAMRQDASELSRDIRVLFHHCRLFGDEPTSIAVSLRTDLERTAVDTIEQACALTTLTHAQLIDIDGELAEADQEGKLYWGMLGERAACLAFYDRLLAGDDPDFEEMRRRARHPFMRGLSLRNQALLLGFWNRVVADADITARGAETLRQVNLELGHVPRYQRHLIGPFAPCGVRAFELDLETTGEIRCARAALAVERYRLDHEGFPDRLDQLAPDYLEKIPVDPFDGAPLRYRVDEDVVTVYSIGENRTDDDGDVQSRFARPRGEWSDVGFVLLVPEQRGRPAVEPSATGPSGTTHPGED